jgi:hypothetical protein
MAALLRVDVRLTRNRRRSFSRMPCSTRNGDRFQWLVAGSVDRIAAKRALYRFGRLDGAARFQQGHRFVHRIQKAFIQFHEFCPVIGLGLRG